MREFKRVQLDGKGDDIISLDGKGNDIFFERPQSRYASEVVEDRNRFWKSESEQEYTKPGSEYETSHDDYGFKSYEPYSKPLTGVKPVPATYSRPEHRWPSKTLKWRPDPFED